MCKCNDQPVTAASLSSRVVSSSSMSSEESLMLEEVTLNLKSSVKLPQVVVLPLRLHRLTGSKRQFRIERRDQSVARGVAEWLQNDPRYSAWFAETDTSAARRMTAETPATKTASEGVRQPADGDLWDAKWPAAKLRDYGTRYGVVWSKDDKKAEVLAGRLRDAFPAFEMKEAEPPAANTELAERRAARVAAIEAMKREELEADIAALGVDLSQVPGTGADGAHLVPDLAGALIAHWDAANGWTEGGEPPKA
jgi:hypothetical protein